MASRGLRLLPVGGHLAKAAAEVARHEEPVEVWFRNGLRNAKTSSVRLYDDETVILKTQYRAPTVLWCAGAPQSAFDATLS